MTDGLDDLRFEVASACRILSTEDFADLTLGHVSARVPGRPALLMKRKGPTLEEVRAEDLIELDLREELPVDQPGIHLEAVLHSEVYRQREDIGAVVHAHPPYATAFSASDASFELLTHDAVLFVDGVARFDETADLITSPEQGRAVARALGGATVVVLRNHGILTVGKNVRWAVLAAVTFERAVRLQVIAAALGARTPLTLDEARAMRPRKYRDAFVDEYWDAWLRRVARLGLGLERPDGAAR